MWWPHADAARPPDLRDEREDTAGDDEFLLGEALLVAPVSTEGARSRRVVMPSGEWSSLWPGSGYDEENDASAAGEVSAGDARVRTLSAPLELVPVLVRRGVIVPLDDGFADPSGPCRLEADDEGASPADVPGTGHAPCLLSFHCWPDIEGTAQGTCVDDSGDGSGPTRRDELVLSVSPTGSSVLTWTRSGTFPPPARVRVVVHGRRAVRAEADGLEDAVPEAGANETASDDHLEKWF